MGSKTLSQIMQEAHVPFWNVWGKLIYKLENILIRTGYVTKPQISTCFKALSPANYQLNILIYNDNQELKKT